MQAVRELDHLTRMAEQVTKVVELIRMIRLPGARPG